MSTSLLGACRHCARRSRGCVPSRLQQLRARSSSSWRGMGAVCRRLGTAPAQMRHPPSAFQEASMEVQAQKTKISSVLSSRTRPPCATSLRRAAGPSTSQAGWGQATEVPLVSMCAESAASVSLPSGFTAVYVANARRTCGRAVGVRLETVVNLGLSACTLAAASCATLIRVLRVDFTVAMGSSSGIWRRSSVHST